MDELLARHTRLTIHRVENGMMVEPNSIYLIPPKKEMIISNGRLLLSDKDQSTQFTLPIDIFFRSLAQDLKTASVGVVLSGTGSDGSIGISKIHEAGGLVIVQSEDSAKFNGMPRSAIETGMADLVLLKKSALCFRVMRKFQVVKRFLRNLLAIPKANPCCRWSLAHCSEILDSISDSINRARCSGESSYGSFHPADRLTSSHCRDSWWTAHGMCLLL